MEDMIRIYGAVAENEISSWFAIAIASVFMLAIIGRFTGKGGLNAINRAGPGLMTTLGVLGTFTGIFIGLLDFNVAQIDASVPRLLDGMKIAFATSIVGMGSAIVFKLVNTVLPEPTSTVSEATPENILSALHDINDSVEKSATRQQEALEDVRRAISAENDVSLLTQVQKLRTSFQDGQQELISEFREFARNMAENNSKALIEALEQVIRDFNTQINEQFGENFKQLNEAVAALLDWQENYKEHVDTMEQRIDAAVLGLELSQVAIENISNRTQKIPEMLEPLESLLAGLQASVTELEAHLEAVSSLKDQAVEAFPVIENNLKTMTTDFGKAVTDAVSSMETSVNEQSAALDDLRGGYQELREQAQNAQEEFARAFNEAIKELMTGYDTLRQQASEAQENFKSALDEALAGMQNNLEKSMDRHATAIDASADEMNKIISDAMSKTQDVISAQFETFDEQMQQELTRALELMGRNLASLSEKFVEDYEPLTNRLRDVVQIAERAS